MHISEIANAYVSNVSDYLSEGQEVNVKIIGIDESGRINLSIKAANPTPAPVQKRPRPQNSQNQFQPRSQNQSRSQNQYTAVPSNNMAVADPPSADAIFEDKLKRFMQDSDSKISGLRQYADKKGSRRRSR